jgi:hypothetical protein
MAYQQKTKIKYIYYVDDIDRLDENVIDAILKYNPSKITLLAAKNNKQRGGKTKNIEYNDLDRKLKTCVPIDIIDGMRFEFSFIPRLYNSDDKFYPLTLKDKTHMMKYIKTFEWRSFLKYNFDQLRPYLLPYYTPEMFYGAKLSTHIEFQNKAMIIIISGIFKKYPYEHVKKIAHTSGALNMTWSDKIKQHFTTCHFYDLLMDGFYKWSQEGEMIIDDIGQLSMGIDTPMRLKILK